MSGRCVVFTRTWWAHAPGQGWPNDLRPQMGRKHVLARGLTEDEARRLCEQWNAEHKPGRLSRKAEYETA